MREERLESIDEELGDISRMIVFKNKRLLQAECGKNYKLCEQLTEEMMTLKSRKRELDQEKRLFERKSKRAKNREVRKQSESEFSDLDGGPCSSKSTTKSRSSTPVSSQIMSPGNGLLSNSESPHTPILIDQEEKTAQDLLTPLLYDSNSNSFEQVNSDHSVEEPLPCNDPHF